MYVQRHFETAGKERKGFLESIKFLSIVNSCLDGIQKGAHSMQRAKGAKA